jgi:hypothetical protein
VCPRECRRGRKSLLRARDLVDQLDDARQRVPAMNDAAGFQHVAVVGGLQRCAGILLDEQNRDAKFAQSHDDAEDLSHDQRSKAETLLTAFQTVAPL